MRQSKDEKDNKNDENTDTIEKENINIIIHIQKKQ